MSIEDSGKNVFRLTRKVSIQVKKHKQKKKNKVNVQAYPVYYVLALDPIDAIQIAQSRIEGSLLDEFTDCVLINRDGEWVFV